MCLNDKNIFRVNELEKGMDKLRGQVFATENSHGYLGDMAAYLGRYVCSLGVVTAIKLDD
jgi:hypothetical protein